MIKVIEGLGVGAGKTYFVTTELIEHFCNGGTAFVVDTMELRWENLKAHVYQKRGFVLQDEQYRPVKEADILTVHNVTGQGTEECPVVIVLDEVQGKLNARDWADKARRDLFAWACQSRHDCNDLWFISQSAANVDKQVRRLATYTHRVRNTKFWGWNVITVGLKLMQLCSFGLHPGCAFVVTTFDADGKTRLGKPKWLEQSQDIFKCYASRSMRGRHTRTGEVIARRVLERRKLKAPWFRWALAAALLSVGVVGCNRIFRKKEEPQKVAKATTVESVQRAPSSPTAFTAPYDVRVEVFRSQWLDRILRSDKWTYEVGRMCPDGMVEVISDGQVRVKQPNGRSLYVLTEKVSVPVPMQASALAPSKTTTPARKVNP